MLIFQHWEKNVHIAKMQGRLSRVFPIPLIFVFGEDLYSLSELHNHNGYTVKNILKDCKIKPNIASTLFNVYVGESKNLREKERFLHFSCSQLNLLAKDLTNDYLFSCCKYGIAVKLACC